MNRSEHAKGYWWALPPLQLTARYYADAVPTEVLAALSANCPRTLRHVVRNYQLSDVSLSYPWIEAFPGIAWSQSFAEVVAYIVARVWPDKELLRQRELLLETDFVKSKNPFYRSSHAKRMLRWLTSKPFRAETLYAVRAAVAQVE